MHYKEFKYIETNKIYWWVRQKKFVHLKIGKTVLVPKSEFEIFLKNNTVFPISELIENIEI